MSAVIDFEVADSYTGNDKEFLKECLGDLIKDAERCTGLIEAGMAEKDFKKIKDAAHEIKGCSSYLGCNRLREASLAVEQVAKTGMLPETTDYDALLKEEIGLIAAFKNCIEEVRAEINTIS